MNVEQQIRAKQREIRLLATRRRIEKLGQSPQRDIPACVIYTFPLIGARSRT